MKVSRIYFFLIIGFFASQSSYAQTEDLGRKGDIIIETGTSLYAPNGTGGAILFVEGASFVNLNLDIGKFISDQFAIKVKGGLTNNGTHLAIGGKYYIANRFPIELSGGFTNYSILVFEVNTKLGYAIPLASNINLEPSIGVLFSEYNTTANLNLAFAMFL